MTNNEKTIENFLKEQNKNRKQTFIWRVFSIICLAIIITLILFRNLNCTCDCCQRADETTAPQSSYTETLDSTTAP